MKSGKILSLALMRMWKQFNMRRKYLKCLLIQSCFLPVQQALLKQETTDYETLPRHLPGKQSNEWNHRQVDESLLEEINIILQTTPCQ